MHARLASASGAAERLAEDELGPRSLERPVALGVEAQRLHEVTLGRGTGRELSAAAGEERQHRRSAHVLNPALKRRQRRLGDIDAIREDGGLDQIGRREQRQTGVARTRSRPGQCLEALERVCRPSQTEVEQRERVRGFRRRQSETLR